MYRKQETKKTNVDNFGDIFMSDSYTTSFWHDFRFSFFLKKSNLFIRI